MPEPEPDDLDKLLAELNGEAIAGQGRLADLLAKTPALETGLDTSEMRHTRRVLYATLNTEGIANAARQLERLPDEGWATSCIMGGNYHGFDIVPAIQRLAGCAIAELLIATLSHDLGHWAWHRDWIEYLLTTGGK